MKAFHVSYEHENKVWSAEFYATDWKDAEARLASLKSTGAVFGEVIERIPAQAGVIKAVEKAINTGRESSPP